MQYKVYNENNVRVTVTDEQLDIALKKSGKELTIELVIAMGASHDKKYICRLNEALYHDKKQVRIEAIYSILSINDAESINILKERERSLPEEEFNIPISEKAILESAIIRLEVGSHGVKNAFFYGDYNPRVKSGLLYNYSSNMIFEHDDLKFIIDALKAYLNKNESWMKSMKREDYEDVIIKGLEGILRIADKSALLERLEDDFNEKLVEVGKQIFKMRIDPYAKEIIATFARKLPTKYGYALLEPIINGNARGDLKKELKKSMYVLKQKERKG